MAAELAAAIVASRVCAATLKKQGALREAPFVFTAFVPKDSLVADAAQRHRSLLQQRCVAAWSLELLLSMLLRQLFVTSD